MERIARLAIIMKKIIIHTRLIFVVAAALLLAKTATAQVLPGLQQSLEQYRQNALQEKLYVHTDKDFYMTGEILWFKIYAVNGGNNTPLNLSKVAYVDVVDNDHNPVMQAKVELNSATGYGSIYIPVSINNGNYKFRVYTNWMKNFSADYYFEKAITIINPLKSPTVAKDLSAAYDVQFFPEGGNMVKNIVGKVAFKVTGSDGKGVNFKGAIVNQRNDTVAKFNPLKFGMGSFMFTPADNNTYKAVLYIAGSKPFIQALPMVNDEGYAMQVTTTNGSYNVVVKSSPANQASQIYLLVHTRGATKVAEEKSFDNGTANFIIGKDKLDDGISSITIFNSAKQPVCERLVFKYPANILKISATADQPLYNTRKKVNVNLSATDRVQNQVKSNLSMAVYRVDSLQTNTQGGIFSYLWLSSDLKGSIESPGYYFENSGATTSEALDNLLLTQGWRRFKWGDVIDGKSYSNYDFLPEYNGHLISAQLKNNSVNIEKAGVLGYLSIPGKNVQYYTAKSDFKGRFVFNTKPLFGPGELISQTDFMTTDSVYRVEVESPFSVKNSDWPLPPVNLEKSLKSALETQSLSMQVQNIYTPAKNNRFFESVVDSSAFYGKADKIYLLDNYTRFPSMEEVLREYVTWVTTSKSKGKFQMRMLNEDNYLEGSPLVLLDGVPVFDIDKAYSIDPLKVKKLEVMHNRYFYGPSVAEGIVSFTTYKGNMGGFEIDPKAVVVDYEGLNLQREFYSPVYATNGQVGSRVPDFRSLLYWAPNVITKTQGKNVLSFYTSDMPGKYIGVVEGITANGAAGSQYFTFEVKK